MKHSNRKSFALAALLASSSALDFGEDDGLSVRASFPNQARVTAQGHLVTQDDFRVAIEKVEFSAENIDLQARDEAQLEEMLNLRTYGPMQTELVLRGARVHGRIFDESGHGRVPVEGLGISGELPVEVVVARTSDIEQPLDVRFEVPTVFFDGVDWSQMG